MAVLDWSLIHILFPSLLFGAFIAGLAVRQFSQSRYPRLLETCVAGGALAILFNTEPQSVWWWLAGLTLLRTFIGFYAFSLCRHIDDPLAAQNQMLAMGHHTRVAETIICIVALFFVGPLAAVALYIVAFAARDLILAVQVSWIRFRHRE